MCLIFLLSQYSAYIGDTKIKCHHHCLVQTLLLLQWRNNPDCSARGAKRTITRDVFWQSPFSFCLTVWCDAWFVCLKIQKGRNNLHKKNWVLCPFGLEIVLSHSCRRKNDERILECKLNYAIGSTNNEIMTNLLIDYFPACQKSKCGDRDFLWSSHIDYNLGTALYL